MGPPSARSYRARDGIRPSDPDMSGFWHEAVARSADLRTREFTQSEARKKAPFRRWGFSLPGGGSLLMEATNAAVYTPVQLAGRGLSQEIPSASGTPLPATHPCHAAGLIGSTAEKSATICQLDSSSLLCEGEHPGIRMCGFYACRSKFRGLFRPPPTLASDNLLVAET